MEENKKINLDICLGTACFVMGSSAFQDIELQIPPQYRNKVEIKNSPCLGLCNESACLKAPFVKIDGEIMGDATLEKIIKAIERKINAE